MPVGEGCIGSRLCLAGEGFTDIIDILSKSRRRVKEKVMCGAAEGGARVARFTENCSLDEVAARQLGADRACYASRDALVCRVGQEEGGSLLAAYRH